MPETAMSLSCPHIYEVTGMFHCRHSHHIECVTERVLNVAHNGVGINLCFVSKSFQVQGYAVRFHLLTEIVHTHTFHKT